MSLNRGKTRVENVIFQKFIIHEYLFSNLYYIDQHTPNNLSVEEGKDFNS